MKLKSIALVIAAVVIAVGVGVWFLTKGSNNPGSQPGGTGSQQSKAAPSITLDVPQDSLLLSQDKKSFQIAIKTSDYNSIARVEYLVDGNFTAYSTQPPFTVEIDISQMSPGQHTLQAIAYAMSGETSKSDVFTFTITESQAAQPADDAAKATVRKSTSIGSLKKSISGSSNSGSTGNNNVGNNGGDNGEVDDPNTPWPDVPVARVCGNTSLLSGPVSAPAGAVILPAGNNSGTDFGQEGAVFWFAPGVHYLNAAAFAQIEPGNDTTFVGAPGAVLDGQGVNQYAFSQHATNVKIQYLTIQNFVAPRDEGVVNHNSGNGWVMEYNTIRNNAGGSVFAGTDNVLRYNCLKDNGQYGFQVYDDDAGGPHNVVLDHNEVVGNNTDDWETKRPGCGCTGGGKFWDAHNVTISNNYVHNNLSVGLWADTNDTDFLVEGNYIADNQAQGLFYEISYNMIVRNNNFIGNSVHTGPNDSSFPAGAIYLSESGGDSRVTGGRTNQIDIYDNNFHNNWAGIILWENADRFCSSAANTSTGYCTIVNPAATLATCTDPAAGGSVNVEPYKSDCRWKTQNVHVHNNTFTTERNNIPNCTNNSSCGFQGTFANVGSFPSWSPYMGDGVQQAIMFSQNNVFSDNTYVGDWKFKAVTQNSNYNFALWQADPFNQDNGSTYNGLDHQFIANAVDTDTATLEDSIGKWTSWYSATPTRSTEQAHTGTHSLKVALDDTFWGVQTTDPTGYPVTPIEKRISFWARLGTGGANHKATMEVQWLDADGNLLSTSQLISPPLTTTWQETSLTLTPPTGVRRGNIVFTSNTGANGSTIFLDDIVVGDTH